MKNYIGCEIVKAEPMDEITYLQVVLPQKVTKERRLLSLGEGYKVMYSDHAITWMGKDFFDAFFRPLSKSEVKFISND